MFATVITFEEDSAGQAAGIDHVLEEVVPALQGRPGVSGTWLVDRQGGRRLSVMLFADEPAYEAAMQAIADRHAAAGARPRPKPASVGRYEVYASV